MRKTTLYFTQEFTKGLLKGILYPNSLPFLTVDAAEKWRKAVTAKGLKGRLPYRIVDYSYQNYAR